MSIEDAIYTRATTHTGLSDLIVARIYPGVASQDGENPCVVYRRISSVIESAMVADTNVYRARFQFTSIGESYESAVNVATQVRAAFKRLQGTVESIVIEDCYLVNENDFQDDDTNLFHVITDFEFVYRS
jgi:hypothetical protein